MLLKSNIRRAILAVKQKPFKSASFLEYLLATTPGLISLLITPGLNHEIVNLSKFTFLCIFSCLLILRIGFRVNDWPKQVKMLAILSAIFSILMLISIPFAQTPILEQIFGVMGRFTGIITYLCLLVICIIYSQISNYTFLHRILKGLQVVGVIEILYVEMQILGIDPVEWVNKKKWIVGTLGNPDYLSTFLAFVIIATINLLINEKRKNQQVLYAIQILLGFHCLWQVGATQGFAIAILGICLIALFFLAHSRNRKLVLYSFSTVLSFIGLLVLLAVSNRGPLKSLIYESSIERRGELWKIAWNMIQHSPFVGFGMDSYGHEYRIYRDAEIVQSSGINRVSNSAHNIFLDLAVGGGVFLSLSYLIVLIFTIQVSLKNIFNSKEFDFNYVTLFSIWMGFNLASLISVNVIGISIWGFICSGLLVGYNPNRETIVNLYRHKFKKSNLSLSKISVSVILVCIGIAPFYKDLVWAESVRKFQLNKIVTSTMMWPQDSEHIDSTVDFLLEAGKENEATELNNYGLSFDQNNFVFWENKLKLSNIETRTVLTKLKQLDPNYNLKE